MRNSTTQRDYVESVLRDKGSITRNFALRSYISRLSSIICDLSKDGWVFETTYVSTITPFGKAKDYKYTATFIPDSRIAQ